MNEPVELWTPEERKQIGDLLKLEEDLLKKRAGVDATLQEVGKQIERFWEVRKLRQKMGATGESAKATG
jgi:hypothetical protein